MGGLASLSQRLRAPHEIVAAFADEAHAAEAKAKVMVYLQWSLAADQTRPPPPPVILLLRALSLDPEEDRLRAADWREPPEVRLEGKTITLDGPRAKHASEVLARILRHAAAQDVLERRKGRARGPLQAIVLAAAALAGAAAAVYFGWVRRHG
jgi:hypothetical protein